MRLRRALARPVTLLLLALIVAAGPGSAPVRAADAPAIPPYRGYVTDLAGAMDEPARARLEGFLDQLEKKTGVQFAVLVVETTAPQTPTQYKERVFQDWKIGDAERDDGLLLLVAIREREARFETGYGLEGTTPDGFQSRVVREVMAPRMRAGDAADGITQAVLAVAARIAAEKGVALEWDGRPLRYDRVRSRRGSSTGLMLALIVFGLVIFALLATARATTVYRPGRRYRRGPWDGGWGGWGGGFSGGGGGGGASFGGFGGGSSGGGGGGGSW
jgi:uncharacterized protein